MQEETLIQIGATALLFAVAIREFFAYLINREKAKAGGAVSVSDSGPAILAELQRMNDNHLHTIQDSNQKLVETVHNGQTKMIEILGRIEGGINSSRR